MDFDDDDSGNHPPEQLLAITSGASTAHTDALAGLQQLAVLDTTINCLRAHAAFAALASLSSLTELCIEMVGVVKLPGSCIARQGLQQLPHLMRLELHTNVRNLLAPCICCFQPFLHSFFPINCSSQYGSNCRNAAAVGI
jgi:hypothetical protein